MSRSCNILLQSVIPFVEVDRAAVSNPFRSPWRMEAKRLAVARKNRVRREVGTWLAPRLILTGLALGRPMRSDCLCPYPARADRRTFLPSPF